eukprot:Rmarinus@m.1400
MFRNQYDTDVVTWSPEGRLYQVEYAMEAVKQGNTSVGLRSDTHVVMVANNKPHSELSSSQKKLFKIDDHIGVSIAGLIADARVIMRYMRTESQSHKYVYDEPISVNRLVESVGDKCQVGTQRSWRRPYGVGLLVAGYDQTGSRLYQVVPSGTVLEYYAHAVGYRDQTAKTYLEKHYKEFSSMSVDDLILHGLTALRETFQTGDVSAENCTVSVVGKDTSFYELTGDSLKPYIERLEPRDEDSDEDDEGDDSGDDEGMDD